MNEEEKPQVGRKVREIRGKRGLSLRGLSELSGLSINAISRIERDECSPTVSSLHSLSAAFGVPITALFDSGPPRATVLVKRNRRMRTQGRGVTMESLGTGLPNQQIEPFLMTLQPGVVATTEPVSHGGQELAYCQGGEVEYQVGDAKYRLEEGDSLLFDARQLHMCRNQGDSPAIVLLVLHGTQDRSMPRHRHLDF